MAEPLGGGQPELGGIAADRVGQLRLPADQLVAYPGQHLCGLLLGRLHRNKPHPRPAHRLADRRGIGRIVLPPLNIRLHILRRQQNGLVPECRELASPIMGSSTVGANLAKNGRTARRRSFLRSTGCSAASTPCSWKTFLDVSIPIRLISFMDGSLV